MTAEVTECKACAHRRAAGFEGQCPACAAERARREMEIARTGATTHAWRAAKVLAAGDVDACPKRTGGGPCEASNGDAAAFDPACRFCGEDIYGDRSACPSCYVITVMRDAPSRSSEIPEEVPALYWDPERTGETVGGLELVGALVCRACGATCLSKRSRPADSMRWKLSKGGRSVDAGGIRLRAENGDGVAKLMARIVRLPELEHAIDVVASALDNLEFDDQSRLEVIASAVAKVRG